MDGLFGHKCYDMWLGISENQQELEPKIAEATAKVSFKD